MNSGYLKKKKLNIVCLLNPFNLRKVGNRII